MGAARGTSPRGPAPGTPTVIDRLPDSFPMLAGESQWLMALLADDFARILADD